MDCTLATNTIQYKEVGNTLTNGPIAQFWIKILFYWERVTTIYEYRKIITYKINKYDVIESKNWNYR